MSSVGEARAITAIIRTSGFSLETQHIPMMGFQVSWKSLDYGFSENNRRVPHFDQLPLLLKAVKEDVFSTVHYYTNRPHQLIYELACVIEHANSSGSDAVHGVQINRVMPQPYELCILKDMYPGIKFTVQLDYTAERKQIIKYAKYYDFADYLLLDSSFGTGAEFDTRQIATHYNVVRDAGFDGGIVVAGGFDHHNVNAKLEQLQAAIGSTDFSIDAESGLRDKLGQGYGNDMLNHNKAIGYLRGAAQALLRQR